MLTLRPLTGVYQIINDTNGKRYVGSTAGGPVEERWKSHRRDLEKGRHHNRHLQAAWNKYGGTAFRFILICRCPPEKCLVIEQKYLDRYQAANPAFGYNISPTAGNTRGVKYPPTIRRKMAEAIKKAHARPDVQANRLVMRNRPDYQENHRRAMEKVHADPAYREKMSTSCRKAQQDPEIKARVLAAHRVAMDRPEYREKQRQLSTGRKHNAETLQKMRDSNTPEVRRKKSLGAKGKSWSEERKARLRYKRSEEVRRNMANGARAGWIKRKARLLVNVRQGELFPV